jgi:antitoxin StbD
MDAILSSHSIGISDLRESPARVFEQAADDVVVVLNHNRPAGYILSTQLMGRILDRVVTDKARDRLATLSTARKITLDEL